MQLAPLANNTKWSELQKLMADLDSRAPLWRTLDTNGFLYPGSGWDGDWTYHFRQGPYKFIEWCEMRPRRSGGAVVLDELIAICKQIGFECCAAESEGDVRVLGYRRLFNDPHASTRHQD